MELCCQFNVKVANETIKKYREVYEPKGLIWRVAEVRGTFVLSLVASQS